MNAIENNAKKKNRRIEPKFKVFDDKRWFPWLLFLAQKTPGGITCIAPEQQARTYD